VAKLNKKTAWTKIELDKGDRVFVDESLGAQHKFDLFEEDYVYLRNFALAHHTIFSNWPTVVSGGIDSYYEKIENQIQRLHRNQVRVSVDFSEQFDKDLLNSLKNSVNLGFFSRPKFSLSELKEEFEKLFGYGFSVVVITMGAMGSAAFSGRDIIYQSAIPTKVVDTLGVGDAFIGAFLSQWVRGKTLKVALEFAAGYAASTCLINGAF
jgi:fructoselysine 6-kinase